MLMLISSTSKNTRCHPMTRISQREMKKKIQKRLKEFLILTLSMKVQSPKLRVMTFPSVDMGLLYTPNRVSLAEY